MRFCSRKHNKIIKLILSEIIGFKTLIYIDTRRHSLFPHMEHTSWISQIPRLWAMENTIVFGILILHPKHSIMPSYHSIFDILSNILLLYTKNVRRQNIWYSLLVWRESDSRSYVMRSLTSYLFYIHWVGICNKIKFL